MSHRARVAFAVLGATLVLAAPTLTKDLWTPDEPRYALVAKEMMQSGDYLVPRRNNELYREKPPLLFWFIAAASWPAGRVTEFTARVPSVLSAVMTLFLTYSLARSLFNERTALWSAAILFTTFRFWWQSNTGQIDMLLAACTTLSLYALWRAREVGGPAWTLVFCAGVALGLLAKGPPALVFAASGVIGLGWKNQRGRTQVPLWLAMLAACIPAALWFYLSRRAAAGVVGSEVSATFTRQIFDRVVSGVSHREPIWYYLQNLPMDWLPWTLLLLWTVIYAWRERRSGPAMRLLLVSFLLPLVFFHLVAEKRALYLLPLYPAAAVIVARSVMALIDEARYMWLEISAFLWYPLTFGVAVFAFIGSFTSLAAAARGHLVVLSLVAAACFAWTALLDRAKAWRHWPAVMAAQCVVLFLVVGADAFPVVNTFKTAKPFCAPVRELAAKGPVTALTVSSMREEYVFYSDVFHTLVLNHLGQAGSAADKGNAALAGLHAALLKTCAAVPVYNIVRLLPDERAALRAAIPEAIESLALPPNEAAACRERLGQQVDEFLRMGERPTPVVVFVSKADWRWIVGAASGTPRLYVLREELVAGRDMLLLANAAAIQ